MCALLRHIYLYYFMIPTNLRMACTLVGASIDLIAHTFENNGLNPILLTQKPIYSVYFCPKKDFYEFTFNPSTTSLRRTLSKAFIWSSKLVYL